MNDDIKYLESEFQLLKEHVEQIELKLNILETSQYENTHLSKVINGTINEAMMGVCDKYNERYSNLTVRMGVAQWFDGIPKRKYTFRFEDGGEQTEDGNRFYLESNLSKPFAMIALGFLPGNLEDNLEYVRV